METTILFFTVAAVVAFVLRAWFKSWWVSLLAPPCAYVALLWSALALGLAKNFPGWGYVGFVTLPIILAAAIVGSLLAGRFALARRV